MNGIMHFVLNGCEKVFCDLTVQRIIDSSGIYICDLLIETALTGANLLDFRNQMVKIILIKDLTIDQPVLVQYIALLRKGVQDLGGPLPELRCALRIDTIADRNDSRQRIKQILIGASVISNLCKFCTSCFSSSSPAAYIFFRCLVMTLRSASNS